MADRRMFSKKITNSARFLKMPLESQALYFHLAQNADDDGVVEGFTVMRLVGSSEDSLKLLVTKGYINILNEDLVVFVVDWLEHNKIRADRKSTTIYKDLLLQQMPEVKLLEPKERSDRKKIDVLGTSRGQPNDRIGEDRLGEDRLGEDRLVIPYDDVLELYNTFCFSLPNVKMLNENRKKRIKSIFLKEAKQNIIFFKDLFVKIENSDFLTGRSSDWNASFDWIIKPANLIKILEDNYKNKIKNTEDALTKLMREEGME